METKDAGEWIERETLVSHCLFLLFFFSVFLRPECGFVIIFLQELPTVVCPKDRSVSLVKISGPSMYPALARWCLSSNIVLNRLRTVHVLRRFIKTSVERPPSGKWELVTA